MRVHDGSVLGLPPSLPEPGTFRAAIHDIWRLVTSSHCIVVAFGAVLLICFATLYVFVPNVYIFIIRLWMPLPLRVPFADTAYVLGQLECWRAGIDVYVTSPCDIFGRTQAYPPIWLRLWFLPDTQRATVPLALLLAMGFIVSLAVLPRIERRWDIVLLAAAIASPITGFAVERGNADLLIFILAAIAVVTAEMSFPGRLVGYAGVMLAALLKLYPVFLFVLLYRERPRTAAGLGLLSISIWVAVGWLWHDELTHAMANLPRPPYWYDGPGARKLAEGLVVAAYSVVGKVVPTFRGQVTPHDSAITVLLGIQLLAAGGMALRLARKPAFSTALDLLNSRETLCLIVGGSLFCGCFAAGVSIAYREILLLFAIPPLLRLSHDHHIGWGVRWLPGMIIFLMWSTLPLRAVEQTFGPLDEAGGPIPTFAFWLICEIMWWASFTVLGAAVFSRVLLPRLEEMRWVVRRAG
jgi:hypothetical protein